MTLSLAHIGLNDMKKLANLCVWNILTGYMNMISIMNNHLSTIIELCQSFMKSNAWNALPWNTDRWNRGLTLWDILADQKESGQVWWTTITRMNVVSFDYGTELIWIDWRWRNRKRRFGEMLGLDISKRDILRNRFC